ncbi:MAG: hypothetical protein PHV02_15435, partial [Rhodocyclaceae bacterium]|nr:hypothetical protein [Rhodocyclaceae bacterium]
AIKGGNLLIFTSLVPSADVCEAGGYSWDYYIDALTGGQLSWPPFVDLTSNAGARKSTIGITPPGTIITEGKGRGSVFQGGSKGELDYYKANLGKNTAGRLSWREILSD